ncbi:MAG TPA: response regulator [Mucilaginibacter sp.]|nr:response regulator [Bacteroidota bacterium]HVS92731.1 response regulator [Mucilaginibacter sp.]
MLEKKISVLYVDDEQDNLFSFLATFRIKFRVLTAFSGDEALKLLETKLVHVIISDQRMPHMTGVELFEKVQEKYPDPVRLLLTGYADMSAVIDAVNKGKIFHYLTKPWNEEELTMAIERAYGAWQEKQSLKSSNEQLEFLLRQKLLS